MALVINGETFDVLAFVLIQLGDELNPTRHQMILREAFRHKASAGKEEDALCEFHEKKSL